MPEPLFYSVPEAARVLKIGTTLLYSQINAGAFPVVRIGRRILVSRVYLESLAKAGDNTTPTPR